MISLTLDNILNNKILIITSSYDRTVDFLISKYTLIDFIRLNVDEFDNYQISITDNGINFNSSSFNTLDLFNEIKSIYFRKIFLPILDEYNIEYHNYMQKEIYNFIVGIADSYEGKVLSKPSLLRKVENKIYQHHLSKKLGFLTPKTIISNDSTFVNNNTILKEWIVKPISTAKITEKKSVLTNTLDYKVTDIELSPSYFQKEIYKNYELRITIINEYIYCVKIISSNIDWRNDKNVEYELIDIPNIVEEQCLEYMEISNLKFAAFDYIYNNDEYYFLECNPNGQWLWLENMFNLDISNKIMEYLSE